MAPWDFLFHYWTGGIYRGVGWLACPTRIFIYLFVRGSAYFLSDCLRVYKNFLDSYTCRYILVLNWISYGYWYLDLTSWLELYLGFAFGRVGRTCVDAVWSAGERRGKTKRSALKFLNSSPAIIRLARGIRLQLARPAGDPAPDPDGAGDPFGYGPGGNRIAEFGEATGALIREYVWLGLMPVAVIEG
ncbi:MAG: hypothetical protein HUJ27_14900 [Rhodobacteraceae bacterium]|nr:hypothetical protein [Paracoccaceae bacterium]